MLGLHVQFMYLVLLVSIALKKYVEDYKLWGMEKDFYTSCNTEELEFDSR